MGIFCGLFFGEMAAALNPIGRAYIRLLQMAIVPYITVSLIAGLGRLTPHQASRIALWGGLVLLLILVVGMVLVLLVPLAYPDWEAASYFSSSLVSSASNVDFVSLYISANPFDSLANTVVPAIVLFSIVMGVAVMFSERKGPLLELLASVDDALMNVTGFMVKLAPIGIFAIAANAAGTLDVAAFDKLQVYVWTYMLLWALLFFVFLPGLLVALTPIRYGELFTAFRIAFITAFVTGSVLVVLPMIIEGINKLLATRDIGDEETDAAVDVLIPTTFNFPSVAMLLILSYILFSGWYAGTPLPLDRYPIFATVGLFVAFGGSNIALPFLLDLFRFPADMFELFLVANVVTNFFFTVLSAMNLVVLTLLTMFLIKRKITPKPMPLAVLLCLLVVGTPILLKITGVVIDRVIAYEYRGYEEFVNRGLLNDGVDVRPVSYRTDFPVAGEVRSRLERIRSTGWLRVGYSPDSLPWAFRNENDEIVGYDMELLHHLARQLNVGIETVLIDSSQIGHALDSNQIDIYASGLMIDASRVGEFGFSRPYSEVTLGLLLADHKREAFQTTRQLDNATGTKIAVLHSPSLLRALEVISPGRELVSVDTPREFLRGDMPDVDALVMPAEAASAWTLVYPQFSVVIPSPGSVGIPIVFALPLSDDTFGRFVGTWIQTSIPLGVMEQAYQHWVLGRETATHQPRWSIVRDVLHWVD